MQESAWIHGWLTHQESLALGWTLVHFCWQGTAIAAVFAVIDRLTARANSGVRYLLALAALGLMPVVVVATLGLVMHSIAAPAVAGARQLSGATNEAPLRVPSAVSALAEKAVVAPARQWWSELNAERVLPWLDAIWLLGVLLLAGRALGGLRELARLRSAALYEVSPALKNSLRALCGRIEIGRAVALRISDEVISPMAMGVFGATILLPVSAVMRLSQEELEAILAHELGHIRRWDYACNLMQTALETVLFFHPAVWLLSGTVRYRREVCCDEIAVANCADALVYAQTLLRLEEQKLEQARLAMALHGNGTLLGRVKRVLGEEGQMENKMTGGVRVAVAGAVLLGLALGPKWNAAVAAVRPAMDQSITAIAAVAQSANVLPKPSPGVKAAEKPKASVSVAAEPEVAAKTEEAPSPDSVAGEGQDQLAQASDTHSGRGTSYIEGMREAGYAMDLNKDFDTLVSMKALGITPEYAKQISSVGYGKPSARDLMSLKAMGVTPEYLAEMKDSGLAPKDLHEAISEKAMGVTPEYARQMKQSGFGDLSVQQLISMKAVGVTPEYVQQMKQSGFADLDAKELVSLKAQGMTPEYVTWLKREFPQITMEQVRRAAVFHLDEKFLADARSHGFDGKDVDKLLRLKMSGLLDE